MSKRRASQETVDAFIRAVYPEMTELCMTANGEEDILREATQLLKTLRAKNATMVDALRGLLSSVPEDVDPRLGYIILQVDREDHQAARDALAGQPEANPEPGQPIGRVSCPSCGASLQIEHGDDPGEIAIISGQPEPEEAP